MNLNLLLGFDGDSWHCGKGDMGDLRSPCGSGID